MSCELEAPAYFLDKRGSNADHLTTFSSLQRHLLPLATQVTGTVARSSDVTPVSHPSACFNRTMATPERTTWLSYHARDIHKRCSVSRKLQCQGWRDYNVTCTAVSLSVYTDALCHFGPSLRIASQQKTGTCIRDNYEQKFPLPHRCGNSDLTSDLTAFNMQLLCACCMHSHPSCLAPVITDVILHSSWCLHRRLTCLSTGGEVRLGKPASPVTTISQTTNRFSGTISHRLHHCTSSYRLNDIWPPDSVPCYPLPNNKALDQHKLGACRTSLLHSAADWMTLLSSSDSTFWVTSKLASDITDLTDRQYDTLRGGSAHRKTSTHTGQHKRGQHGHIRLSGTWSKSVAQRPVPRKQCVGRRDH